MLPHILAYFSPAGTTRLIADTIREQLTRQHCAPVVVELGSSQPWPREIRALLTDHPSCLWLGSPVYCDHAVPLIHEAIQALPIGTVPGYAVPFVTWGGVTSGLALPEMARQLAERGYLPLAAAKILAVHSSMWRTPQPLAAGHPDQEDLQLVRQMVEQVTAKLQQPQVPLLALACLEYLSPALRADAAAKSLAAIKAAAPPLVADSERCQRCGACAEACPVAAITLDQEPVFDRLRCVLCLQCVRACPHQAIPVASDAMAARIMAMAGASDEAKVSRIFL